MIREIEAPTPTNELNVLIVDNQSLIHDQVNQSLIELGVANVFQAYNAFHANRMCQERQFDIVFLAFNVSHDKDGFHLFEELKHHNYITDRTSVIFLSAETTPELVNCIIELQPDDFWVKPLNKNAMLHRLRTLFAIRIKLNKLLQCLYMREYAAAIYHAERQLQDSENIEHFPRLKRIIGECLLKLRQFEQAQHFYAQLVKEYDHVWVHIGLLNSLLKQKKSTEATDLAKALLIRDDTRFNTYDLLAEHHIQQDEFDLAYDMMKRAASLAPRNIERNKKLWDLARLNRDKEGQLDAVKKMAKYAKNSIHDSPQLTLNVVRASLDLASSVSQAESNLLLAKLERELASIYDDANIRKQLENQLCVIEVRKKCLKNKKKEAEDQILNELKCIRSKLTMEDNLDLMKAYHELGMREDCLNVLNTLTNQLSSDSFSSRVVNEYLAQESIERKNIQYTTKELKEMAAINYRENRFQPAYTNLKQASTLSPQNKQIALSLLKVVVQLHKKQIIDEEHLNEAGKAYQYLLSQTLSNSQRIKIEEYGKTLCILPTN